MPWSIEPNHDECPSDESFAVVKDSDGSVAGCHDSRESAQAQIAALNIAETERGIVERVIEKLREFFGLEHSAEKEQAISSLRLYEQIWAALDRAYADEWPWLTDFYVDDGGQMFAVFASDGKIFRVDFTVQGEDVTLGERTQVTETFAPVNTMRIVRQADGRHRWFSVSATSALNRCAEIDSRDLFDSFIAHAQETGEYPYRCFCHRGEQFKTGQADFLARDDNCYITSGVYDDSELAKREIAAWEKEPDFWGESIGYEPLDAPEMARISGIEIPVYQQGIHIEISTLPEDMAAAWFTSTNVMEASMKRQMDDKTFAAFAKLFEGDEDKARSWLEENVDPTNRAIEEREMVTRDNGEGEQEPGAQPEPEPQPEPPAQQVIELDDEAVAAIVGRMTEAGPLAELTGQLETLTKSVNDLATTVESVQRSVAAQMNIAGKHKERLDALERDEEKKQDAWVKDLPARVTMPARVTYRPSVAHSRRLTEPASDLAARAQGTLANMQSRTS